MCIVRSNDKEYSGETYSFHLSDICLTLSSDLFAMTFRQLMTVYRILITIDSGFRSHNCAVAGRSRVRSLSMSTITKTNTQRPFCAYNYRSSQRQSNIKTEFFVGITGIYCDHSVITFELFSSAVESRSEI